MATVPASWPSYSTRWPAQGVYRHTLLKQWVSATPEITWSPAPSGTAFSTPTHDGVVFTASSTVTFGGTSPRSVQYLIVAGGGGGGKGAYSAGPTYNGGLHSWGGGGAGGYRNSVPGETSGGGASAEAAVTVAPGPYPIVVGAGGAFNTNGSNSSVGFPAPLVSTGGGYGGRSTHPAGQYGPSPTAWAPGQPGGSGGGGSHYDLGPGPGTGTITPAPGGSGTANQGYGGGAAGSDTPPWNVVSAGGGGGAGEAGKAGRAPLSPTNSVGGAGLSSSITGTAVTRAGGGGGGGYSTPGAGGSGGGGTAASTSPQIPTSNATANTGGGGGGGYYALPDSGGYAGGSGVVILRWPK